MAIYWHCADCGGQFWPDQPGWAYKTPKPDWGSIAVCPECNPVPWYRKKWPAMEASG